MLVLTTEQNELLHFYYNLLNTIEEGFDYVIESFSNYELTEGDTVLKDILSAFYHVDSSNKTLQIVLKEEQAILDELTKFDSVIISIDAESSIFTSLENHHDFVKNQLAPAFLAWKELVQGKLQPYVTQ